MGFAVPTPIYGIAPITLIIAAFALPLLSVFIKSKRFYDVYATVFAAFALYVATMIFIDVWRKGMPVVYPFGGWVPPLGIVYEIDLFGAFLGLVVASVMMMIVLYSVWYTEGIHGYEWYYTLLLGLEAGMLGCIYTGDVFNLFVMLEVTSLSAYGLVAFYRGRAEAVEAAIKYAMLGAVATTMYFLSTVFIYGSLQTLHIADAVAKIALRAGFTPSGFIFGNPVAALAVALGLALWAFTFKAAVFPNHFWLPDAHPEAPAPVSAALSGLVVKVGIYAIARFMYTLFCRDVAHALGMEWFRDALLYVLMALGALSAFVGAVMMSVQRDIKRLLAYSTVSHVGLVTMALALGFSGAPREATILAITGAILHILNHSVGKAMLFMSTGVAIKQLGTRDIDDLGGVGRRLPITGFATMVGTMHLLGVPPFGGFVSKLLMYQAFLAAGMPLLAAFVVIVSAISVLGYARIVYSLVVQKRELPTELREHPVPSFVLLTMSLACIAIFVACCCGGIDALKKVTESLLDVGSYVESYFALFAEMSKHIGWSAWG